MKQRIRHLLSVLLVCTMVLSLLPMSVLADGPDSSKPTEENSNIIQTDPTGDSTPTDEPETQSTPVPANDPETAPQVETPSIYVSAQANGTQDGTQANPYASLKKAVDAAPDGATIYVMTNLTINDLARVTDKHVTITSATGEGYPYTITRGELFNTASDTGRSWYNPAMIEVTVSENHTASVTLKNIVLDDGGKHEGSIFAQANQITPANPNDESNLSYVQDAIIAAYGLAENSSRIILDEGAVLKNFGGMSAVRVTGGASLVMNAGSVICDDTVKDRTKEEGGKIGPAGAVWVQGTSAVMNSDAEIHNVVGRAFYVEGGNVTINGKIYNISADADMWNAGKGVALHLRGGSDGTVGGLIKEVNPDLPDSSVIFVENSSFELSASGTISSCHNTSTVGEGGLIYANSNSLEDASGVTTYFDFDLYGKITECSVNSSLLYVVNTYQEFDIGPEASITNNTCKQLCYHNTAENNLNIYGDVSNNTCESSVFNGQNTGHYVTLYNGAKVNNNTITGDGGVFNFGANRIITMKEGSEICNNTVKTGSIISVVTEGTCFNMQGGTISGNKVTSGSLFSFDSGSWNWPSKFEIKGGTISGNTAPHNFTVAVHDKEKIPNIGSYFLVPNNGMNEVYFEKESKTVTVDSETKLGNANYQQTKYAVTPDELVNKDPRSVDHLITAAELYSCKDPFATFWAQNANGTPVTVKMDSSDAFDSSKSVYVLIEATDEKGAPAAGAEVQLLPAVVNTDGAISFTLPGNDNGYAVGLVQVDPSKVKGTLTLTTSVTELTQGNTPYTIPYTATFTPNSSTELWTIENVEFTSPLFIAGEVALINNTAQWTATLDNTQFRAGQSVDAVAILTVKIDDEEVKILSNSVSTTMIGSAITITPADITIYMGGDDGYDAVVGDNSANAQESDTMPTPLFYVKLPAGLSNVNATTISLTGAGGREWKFEQAGQDSAGKALYYIHSTGYENQDPVRVTFKGSDGNFHLNDTFNPTTVGDLCEEYTIAIYSGNAGTVNAHINGENYAVAVGTGTLYVRAVDETSKNPVVPITETVSKPVAAGSAAVTAPAGTTYTMNNTTVPASSTGASLLFDGIIDDAQHDRTGALLDAVESDYNITIQANGYQAQYLDLVDADDGNAWIKASKPVTVYWGYPQGTDSNTNFILYHFTSLHRSGSNSGFDINDIAGSNIEVMPIRKTDYGIAFDVQPGNFSPFVLVYGYTANTTPGTGTRDDYTLHYVVNGGEYVSSETHSSPWTKPYEELPIPVRDGYTFEGWYTDLRLTQPVTGDIRVDSTTVDLYAKWSGGKDYGPDDTGVSKWLETDEHNAFLSGYPDGSFLADKNMTRAEVAQMFYSLLLDKDVTITKSFSDVPSDAWYAKAVNTLSSLGMLGGYPDGTFRPDAPITRAEFAAIALAFAYDPANASCSYTDVSTVAWYYTYVAQATTYGWIGGYPDGSFRPNNSITRAEVAVIVNNMLGREADENYIDRNADDLVNFVDLSTSHWAYYTIMEATNTHDYTSNSAGETWTA